MKGVKHFFQELTDENLINQVSNRSPSLAWLSGQRLGLYDVKVEFLSISFSEYSNTNKKKIVFHWIQDVIYFKKISAITFSVSSWSIGQRACTAE